MGSLPDEVRSFMEPRFSADFSCVQVHTDSAAVLLNRDLNAQAFTYGSDIYFGAGKFPGNNELTAHELTHVVQQTGGVQAKPLMEQMHLGLTHDISLSSKQIQRREVCDREGICWSEDENASYPQKDMSENDAAEVGQEALQTVGYNNIIQAALTAGFLKEKEVNQFADAVREIQKRIGRKLSKDEIRRLHDAISGHDYGFHDIVEEGVGMFGG